MYQFWDTSLKLDHIRGWMGVFGGPMHHNFGGTNSFLVTNE